MVRPARLQGLRRTDCGGDAGYSRVRSSDPILAVERPGRALPDFFSKGIHLRAPCRMLPRSRMRGHMPKFLIEREMTGAGKLSPEQLQTISEKSCSVLRSLGPQIQWVQSYVTDDKLYCVYIAANEQAVREHARIGGFPANRVSEIRTTIDPTTAEKTSPRK